MAAGSHLPGDAGRFNNGRRTDNSRQPRAVLIKAMLLELKPTLIKNLLSTPMVAFKDAAQSANRMPLPR